MLPRILLAGILFVALALRVFHTQSGLPYLHYHDEPFITFSALNILKTGDWNPHFFEYPSLSIDLCLGVDVFEYFRYQGSQASLPVSIDLEDIRFEKINDGQSWISLPEFIQADRFVIAGFGALAVALAAALAWRVGGPWAGVLAAVVLTPSQQLILQGSNVNVDSLVLVFVQVAFLAALVWRECGGTRWLVLAASGAGLAMASKYNAGLAWFLVLGVMGEVAWRKRVTEKEWGLALVLPLAIFLVTTPYAVLDLPHFVRDSAYQFHHYFVAGDRPEWTVTPGVSHLFLQLNTVAQNLGVFVATLAVVGLAFMGNQAERRWIVIYFGVLAWFMARTKVSFHRNFHGLYVLAAVAFGCAVVEALQWLRKKGQIGPQKVLAAGLVLWGGWNLGDGWLRERHVWQSIETRSQAIPLLNKLALERHVKMVGVAKELALHPRDYQKIVVPHVQLPLAELLAAKDEYPLVLTAATYGVAEPTSYKRGEARKLSLLVRSRKVAGRIEGQKEFPLDEQARNPEIVVLEGKEE